ncbi:adenylosuccinate lyase [Cognatishimia sp. F0-27]|uniref:adenylosuccinate lyase n=1 Tax=Cognatishimia sp. F0-27 TaxID=2816855 RepID=UPI001D0CBB03|nr:adenylosuccinate lyase [Cognatishimia sp. F0-27]MCC1492586.1 adenylosuccinate lyase [Cognatishimia sp. F0-27]
MKVILTSAALIVASSLAATAECSWGKHQQAMSCAEGSVYDAESNSCKVVSS